MTVLYTVSPKIYFTRTGPNTSSGSAHCLRCLPNLSNSKPLCGGGGAIIFRTSTPGIIYELFSKQLNLSLRTHAFVLLSIIHQMSSLRHPKLILSLQIASCLTFWRRILIQTLIGKQYERTSLPPFVNRTTLCLIPRYHASKKSDE